MKPRTFVILVILAAILIGWAIWSQRPPAASGTLGGRVCPDLDINLVHSISIVSTNRALTLAKKDQRWGVKERFGYPADFDKIVALLRQLADMTVGQVLPGAAGRKASMNLLDPAQDNAEGAGIRVELRAENGDRLAGLLVGKQFMRQSGGRDMGPLAFGDYADGRYIETDAGHILLTSSALDELLDTPREWLDNQFLNLPASDVMDITVSGPDRDAINLTRPQPGQPLELTGLQEGEGTLDVAKADRMAGALSYLAFEDVADPEFSMAETGLDQPVVFEIRTRHGQCLTLRIGRTVNEDSMDRYVRVSAAWEAPAAASAATEEDGEDEAAGATGPADEPAVTEAGTVALNERLSPWVYTLKSYRIESMLFQRADLIQKPEPPAATEAEPASDSEPAAE